MTSLRSSPVTDAAQDLARSLSAAVLLVAHPDATAPAMITGASPPASAPPWNPAAAYAVYGSTETVARLEASLRKQVTGRPGPRRGGSFGNTVEALRAIIAFEPAIGHHDHPPDKGHRCTCDCCRVAYVLTRLTNVIAGLPAIDELTRWVPIRLRKGGEIRPPTCPYCKTFSLRVAFERYVVMCFRPGCEDGAGERPFARLAISNITAEPVLAWNDGLVT